METVLDNTTATVPEPWMPPQHLLWKKGRVYTAEETREALIGCFTYLLGEKRLRAELETGGFKELADVTGGKLPSAKVLGRSFEHLKTVAGNVCNVRVVIRSIYRLKFVLRNCSNEAEVRAFVERPGEVYMIACENDIATAREAAMKMAQRMGFSLTHSTSIATAVSELARNILHYANDGRILLSSVNDGEKEGMKIHAVDSGPGIANIDEVLSGDFVSKTGMGLGLLGTKRLLDEFMVDTAPGMGTKVTGIKYGR